MTTFNGLDLFSSGPHRLEIGGRTLRHVLHQPPGSDGVQLGAQGRSGRAIAQVGDLVADDALQMGQLIDALEATMDGRPHDLVDEDGVVWSNVVMLSFEPQALTRLGARVRTHYRIQYLQVTA